MVNWQKTIISAFIIGIAIYGIFYTFNQCESEKISSFDTEIEGQQLQLDVPEELQSALSTGTLYLCLGSTAELVVITALSTVGIFAGGWSLVSGLTGEEK
jgi:hypothetical protein